MGNVAVAVAWGVSCWDTRWDTSRCDAGETIACQRDARSRRAFPADTVAMRTQSRPLMSDEMQPAFRKDDNNRFLLSFAREFSRGTFSKLNTKVTPANRPARAWNLPSDNRVNWKKICANRIYYLSHISARAEHSRVKFGVNLR